MPKFSNQLLDDSNVEVLVGASDGIKFNIDIGNVFGKFRTFSINMSELSVTTLIQFSRNCIKTLVSTLVL